MADKEIRKADVAGMFPETHTFKREKSILCPFNFYACNKEECGMWDSVNRRCSVRSIADRLSNMCDILEIIGRSS